MTTRCTCHRTLEDGGLFAVPGLRGAAVATGIKRFAGLDLAVIAADEPWSVAGVFTTNRCAAAPVVLCRDAIRRTPAVRSIVINSGNANALTGSRGEEDAASMKLALEEACGGPGLVLSTGVIGAPLPIAQVLAGIHRAARSLTASADDDVSRAMLTTDRRRKKAAVVVGEAAEERGTAGALPYIVGGVAKGSGMVHPNMATILAVVATDAPIAPRRLREMLGHAVDQSFHCISVDGDMSTNDSVLLLARPPGPNAPEVDGPMAEAVESGIEHVCRSLSEQIVGDGEGVNRTMEIQIHGAVRDEEARQIAESIARSTRVKAALAGAASDWGQILAAAGAAGVDLDLADCSLQLDSEMIFDRGQICDGSGDRLKACASDDVRMLLTVGKGTGRARMVTTDLSKRYIEINSEYALDPSSRGIETGPG